CWLSRSLFSRQNRFVPRGQPRLGAPARIATSFPVARHDKVPRPSPLPPLRHAIIGKIPCLGWLRSGRKMSVSRQSTLHNGSRIPQARAWQDPRVGVDVERYGTTRFDTFTDAEWMVGQEVPVSGKNRWRGRAAAAEADAAQVELRRRELELSALARGAYYRLG